MSLARASKILLLGVPFVLAHCMTAPSERVVDGESALDETAPASGSALVPVSAGPDPTRRRGDVVADAIAYATTVLQAAGTRAPELAVAGVARGVDGRTHVRLQQKHSGLPVHGADVVVHANDGGLLGLAGNAAIALEGLDVATRAKTAAIDEARALGLAKADRFGGRPIPTSNDAVARVVWIDEAGAAHLALHTSFFNELEGEVQPGSWNHVFDAQTGALLSRWDELQTVTQASGPGGNAKVPRVWSSELDAEAQGEAWVLTTTRLKTISMAPTGSGAGAEVVAALDGFVDAPVNDAHGYAEITLEVLKAFGHDSIDDNGFRIVSRVHYGRNYENAFWNGSQMTYGDGKNRYYALSGALDVVAHEIHHGFTAKHSKLAYRGESGGMNESFSDIAGKTAEFFYKENPSWDLGFDVFKPTGALRYMCNPTQDGRSIDHLSKMRPGLNVHYSSGISNKAFCRLSKRLSTTGDADGTATKAGVMRAAQAYYLANAHYWTSSSTFVQACQGTVDAARALGYDDRELDAIKTSWVDVGVYCDGLVPPPPPPDGGVAAP